MLVADKQEVVVVSFGAKYDTGKALYNEFCYTDNGFKITTSNVYILIVNSL